VQLKRQYKKCHGEHTIYEHTSVKLMHSWCLGGGGGGRKRRAAGAEPRGEKKDMP